MSRSWCPPVWKCPSLSYRVTPGIREFSGQVRVDLTVSFVLCVRGLQAGVRNGDRWSDCPRQTRESFTVIFKYTRGAKWDTLLGKTRFKAVAAAQLRQNVYVSLFLSLCYNLKTFKQKLAEQWYIYMYFFFLTWSFYKWLALLPCFWLIQVIDHCI